MVMGDLRESTEEIPVRSLSTLTNPSPSSIGPQRWAQAEIFTRIFISKVQPTAVSEQRRRQVIDYVQRLIRGCLGCEVFPYGSVPLKTYLPDGDIDLTAFGGASFEDAMANEMVSVLEGEDQNSDAEFVVKDVQLIRAEVKLVKCIVQNIVVDISFNQIGGLCTLCFLEQVDRLIGKDYLFKRSIILIKAWCYYESRILGAHHGLISTYALETLVLYIFHLFHSELNGPLAVLYRFLDYFSKFDWDIYGISLIGPVRISSLSEIEVKAPENDGRDLLLSNDFLRFCVDTFSVPSRGVDINSRTFLPKHLNIVDPLKQSNNLGRSVSKGNFYRIRSAFTYGARKLGKILLLPEDNIADELCKFFSNTLDRHGSGQRPDVQDPIPISQEYKVVSNFFGRSRDSNFGPDGSTQDSVNNIEASGTEMKFSRMPKGHQIGCMNMCNPTMPSEPESSKMKPSRMPNGPQRSSMNLCPPTMPLEAEEANSSTKGSAPLRYRVSGDAKELATTKIQSLKISNDSVDVSPPSVEESVPSVGMAYHAPHLYFSNSKLGNGKMRHGELDPKQSENSENKVSSGLLQAADEGRGNIIGPGQDKNLLVGDPEVHVTSVINPVAFPETRHVNCWNCASASTGSSETLNLPDLRGDYENHLNCLRYGWWCYEHASSSLPTFTMPQLPPHLLAQFQNNNSWDAIQRSSQLKWNGLSHGSTNGVVPSPVFYPMNHVLVPSGMFGLEEMPKPRGTGTYFPNMNRPPQGYRPSSTVRGRNQTPMKSPRNNGWGVTLNEANTLERSSHELSQSPLPIDHVGGKPGCSDIRQYGSPREKVLPYANDLVLQSEGGVVDFGSVGHMPFGEPLLLESSRRPRLVISSPPQVSSQGLPTPGTQKPKSPLRSTDQDRVTIQSTYHLKDNDDFPPLSV